MQFDNPIVILIILVAVFLRWLSKRSENAEEESDQPNVPGQPVRRNTEAQTEEERIRRFLEALGQPADSKPPPKVVPRRQHQAQPRVFPSPDLPPLTAAPSYEPKVPTPIRPIPPPLPPKQQRLFAPTTQPEPVFDVQEFTAHAPEERSFPPARRGTGHKALLLGSVQDLRNAIVLREILGPPRSLQPLDSLL